MVKDKISSIIFSISIFFFIITLSISLPIYFRPFYYLHINALDLVEESGHSYSEIKEAYDNVLDYLTLPNKEFSVGVMNYSEIGASHFADCKALFNLNAVILFFSGFIILIFILLKKLGKIKEYRYFNRSPSFLGASTLLSLTVVLTSVSCVNFYNTFTVFHKIFFYGKDNWIFDPRYDEIINILPEQFFMNCAIFIVCGIITGSLAIIIREAVMLQRQRKN